MDLPTGFVLRHGRDSRQRKETLMLTSFLGMLVDFFRALIGI
ncbi:hypothetical protein V7968_31610 [Nocardia vulneris]|nr:hypothetical protein [Nocardia brasiliensis]